MHLKRPFYGSRRIRDWLQDEGHAVNRKRVQRLMWIMGITALYPKPQTSKPGEGHKVYPYLLRGLTIDRPNQVWATDLTHIPMARFCLSGCHHGLVQSQSIGLAAFQNSERRHQVWTGEHPTRCIWVT